MNVIRTPSPAPLDKCRDKFVEILHEPYRRSVVALYFIIALYTKRLLIVPSLPMATFIVDGRAVIRVRSYFFCV